MQCLLAQHQQFQYISPYILYKNVSFFICKLHMLAAPYAKKIERQTRKKNDFLCTKIFLGRPIRNHVLSRYFGKVIMTRKCYKTTRQRKKVCRRECKLLTKNKSTLIFKLYLMLIICTWFLFVKGNKWNWTCKCKRNWNLVKKRAYVTAFVWFISLNSPGWCFMKSELKLSYSFMLRLLLFF